MFWPAREDLDASDYCRLIDWWSSRGHSTGIWQASVMLNPSGAERRRCSHAGCRRSLAHQVEGEDIEQDGRDRRPEEEMAGDPRGPMLPLRVCHSIQSAYP